MAAGAIISGPADAPPVVLIHGLAGSHHTWDRVVPLIEANARVLALDIEGSASIEREADEAAALIGLAPPALFVGHSRGGLVATAIAERHPELVRRAILLCTPWAPESRLAAAGLIERALSVPFVGDLLWAATGDNGRRVGLRTAFAAGTPVPDGFVADLSATGRRRLVAASRAIDAYLDQAPLAKRLTTLHADAELFFGEYDARVAPPPPTILAHTVLADVGHTPPWEDPERVAELITTSIRKPNHADAHHRR